MPDPQVTQRTTEPDHRHHRTVIAVLGIGIVLLILGFRYDELMRRLDALSSVATGVATIAGAIVVALRADEQRKEQRLAAHRDAWRTIVSSAGHSGSFGRLEAIEFLASEGVVLDGIDLSGAYLHFLRVPSGTSLMRSRFGRVGSLPCVLSMAQLSEVLLSGSSFIFAELTGTKFRRSIMTSCSFDSVEATECDYSDAQLFALAQFIVQEPIGIGAVLFRHAGVLDLDPGAEGDAQGGAGGVHPVLSPH